MIKTVLDIVQDILSEMSSDEVNSINDTIESMQVAQIVKSVYLAMMSNRNWPHQRKLIQIEPSGDDAYPTHMKLQTPIKEMCFINYDCVKDGETRKRYRTMKWAEPDDFLRSISRRNNDQDNIDVIIDPSGVELLIRNDLAPTYYTSFDDTTLIFDSYDRAVDDTLQKSKIQAMAYVMPVFLLDDNFIPEIPEEARAALLEEAKSRAFITIKQMANQKAEQEAQRQQAWLSRKAWRVNGGIKYPNYGRNSMKYQSSPYFDKHNKKPTP